MTNPPIDEIRARIDEDKPNHAPGLLSVSMRHRLIERAILGLYRWYNARSQVKRNWNPDRDFDWQNIRQDHSEDVVNIIQGFFAVEQYTPDYVGSFMYQIRRNHGRSHFLLRWGSEEEKHGDLWRNTLLFTRARTPDWVDQYMLDLRRDAWTVPWEDPVRMLFYQTIQERATQVNYLKLGEIAQGRSDKPEYADDKDPVLMEVCKTIAVDEAAHYDFFLECARVHMYYFPEHSMDCLNDVIKHFAMPAGDLIPDYDQFFELALRAGVYGPREYAKDVIQVALGKLGIAGRKALERGVKATREVPDPDGNMKTTAIFETLDYEYIRDAVKRLFGRIHEYERETGLDAVDPTPFVPTPA